MKLSEILIEIGKGDLSPYGEHEVVVQIDDRVYTVEDVLVKVENQTIYLEIE